MLFRALKSTIMLSSNSFHDPRMTTPTFVYNEKTSQFAVSDISSSHYR